MIPFESAAWHRIPADAPLRTWQGSAGEGAAAAEAEPEVATATDAPPGVEYVPGVPGLAAVALAPAPVPGSPPSRVTVAPAGVVYFASTPPKLPLARAAPPDRPSSCGAGALNAGCFTTCGERWRQAMRSFSAPREHRKWMK